MFTIKNVRILSCEEKEYNINGKKGNYYPTMIRLGENKVFSMTSKTDLSDLVDETVDLAFEFQNKASKTAGGKEFVSPRILGLAEGFGSDNLK